MQIIPCTMDPAMLILDAVDLRYEPFPIGLIKPAIKPDNYESMIAGFPPKDLFMYFPKVGNKYVLSEKFHGDKYHEFIRKNSIWEEFHSFIKSPNFIMNVLSMLKNHGINLGFKHYPLTTARRLKTTWRDLKRGMWPRYDTNLSARFEFSMLSADGGSVTPHTDNPSKFITLVISMARPGEWDPAWGGGTDVNRMKDPCRSFNRMNAKAEFDEVEVIDTFPFEPNQAVIFIKTFNSWHAVRPMTGPDPELMRRTLTINIEEDE